jgi:histidine triad (HIT) family protein
VKNMPDADSCIFCKIAKKELPCALLYEDEAVLAFLDLAPVQPGHTLLIPRLHASTLLDLPPDGGQAILRGLQTVGGAMRTVLRADGFNCLQNNFPAAGQQVMHAHWHLIPRFTGDHLDFNWHPGKYESRDVMLALAAKFLAFWQK